MTTSPPNAWAWLDGRDVPVSIDSLNLSVSDTFREQNDSDQCSDCRCAPGQPHSEECDCTAQVADSVINAVPEHTTCDVSQTGNFPVTGNIVVESCPECGGVTDIGGGHYGEVDKSGHTPDDNPLLNHMECTFNSCMDIAVAKNEGYAGSADPMANFNDSVRLGVPVPIGVALRLSDKWSRLCRLLQTGENPLADESITDTIMDAVNYLAILLYALEDEGSPRR